MLHLYISHAPGDKKYLDEFLKEIKPMQEKYSLRIWYNHPDPKPVIPFPWSLLFFWYRPPGNPLPYNRFLQEELEHAHIYLFFTSQKSLNVPWVEQVELRSAMARYQQYGNRYIRIFPVLVSASQWKVFSDLVAFPSLGPSGKYINQVASGEAWGTVTAQLKPVIEELSRNHLEENKRLGLPLSPKPAKWKDTPQVLVPFPQWLGWAMLIAILFSVGRSYEMYCTRKVGPAQIRRNPTPEEYRRENPLRPPEEVVMPPDTI